MPTPTHFTQTHTVACSTSQRKVGRQIHPLTLARQAFGRGSLPRPSSEQSLSATAWIMTRPPRLRPTTARRSPSPCARTPCGSPGRAGPPPSWRASWGWGRTAATGSRSGWRRCHRWATTGSGGCPDRSSRRRRLRVRVRVRVKVSYAGYPDRWSRRRRLRVWVRVRVKG